MGKRGPKGKFNDRLKETFIRLSKEGKTLEEVAEVVGVSTRTLTNWMGKHQDLLLAVREARQLADELVEASLFHRALGYSHPAEKIMVSKDLGVIREPYIEHYPPDTQAATFWLKNRQPKRWRERNILEHSGPNGGPIETKNLSALTDEQIDARIAEKLKKQEQKEEK